MSPRLAKVLIAFPEQSTAIPTFPRAKIRRQDNPSDVVSLVHAVNEWAESTNFEVVSTVLRCSRIFLHKVYENIQINQYLKLIRPMRIFITHFGRGSIKSVRGGLIIHKC